MTPSFDEVARREALPPDTERQLQTTVEARPQPGETTSSAYQRMEQELGAQFATLSVLQARALHRRLGTPKPGDALAAAFHRLIPERKSRLLVFLADARRREAIASARTR